MSVYFRLVDVDRQIQSHRHRNDTIDSNVDVDEGTDVITSVGLDNGTAANVAASTNFRCALLFA